MKSHLGAKSFTNMIASMTQNEDIRDAVECGNLHIQCDHAKKKFWFARCPEHIWDSVISEVKKITNYSPLADDIPEFDEEELAM